VIDADSRYQGFLYQLERDAMNIGEHFRTFYTDSGQIVDIEKPAVVNLVRGDSPETQAVGLIVEHFFQRVKTVRVAFGAIDDDQYFLQTCLDDVAVLDQGGEPPANDFFFP